MFWFFQFSTSYELTDLKQCCGESEMSKLFIHHKRLSGASSLEQCLALGSVWCGHHLLLSGTVIHHDYQCVYLPIQLFRLSIDKTEITSHYPWPFVMTEVPDRLRGLHFSVCLPALSHIGSGSADECVTSWLETERNKAHLSVCLSADPPLQPSSLPRHTAVCSTWPFCLMSVRRVWIRG